MTNCELILKKVYKPRKSIDCWASFRLKLQFEGLLGVRYLKSVF